MSGMDILEFLCIMVPVLLAGGAVFRYIGMKDAANRYKAQKDAQISAQNRKAAQMKGQQKNQVVEEIQVGPWLPELLAGFGINPDVIFEDEMPEDLARFLPLVKGYVNAQGGLPGLAAQLQQKGAQAPQEEMVGGPGWG